MTDSDNDEEKMYTQAQMDAVKKRRDALSDEVERLVEARIRKARMKWEDRESMFYGVVGGMFFSAIAGLCSLPGLLGISTSALGSAVASRLVRGRSSDRRLRFKRYTMPAATAAMTATLVYLGSAIGANNSRMSNPYAIKNEQGNIAHLVIDQPGLHKSSMYRLNKEGDRFELIEDAEERDLEKLASDRSNSAVGLTPSYDGEVEKVKSKYESERREVMQAIGR